MRLGDVSGEAMHYTAQSVRGPVLVQNCEEIVPGIVTVLTGAAVDQNGELCGCGKFQLLAEDLLLHVAG